MDEPRGVLRVLDDLWNPVLVKEVRQALRGRLFHVCFLVTLVGVTIVSMSMVVGMHGDVSHQEGRDFFLGIYACLAIAVVGLVPFSAFNAMGSEWDENTFDLLVISNLRPWRIVLGKLFGALTQAMLFYSAFTPFLVFSFLLRGIDLLVVGVTLGISFVCSTGLTVVAIMLSTFSKVKFARVALMALLVAALVGVTTGSIAFTEELLRSPGDLREPEAIYSMLAFVLGTAMVASFCFFTACNMLSHAEENRSTGVRVLLTGSLLAAFGFIASFAARFPVDRSVVSAITIVILLVSLLPALFFVTEPERMGKRVAPRVPRNRLLALLASPWLPGGGRGMLLFLVHTGMIVAFCLVEHATLKSSSARYLDDGMPSLLALAGYAVVYLGLPSAVQARFTDRARYRVIARVSIPALALVFAFIPALVGFFIGERSLVQMRHAGNPAFLMEQVWGSSGRQNGIQLLLVCFVVLAVSLNFRRIGLGVQEVLRASARRAAGESASPTVAQDLAEPAEPADPAEPAEPAESEAVDAVAES